MIEGVVVKKVKVIPDERGRLMEMVRCDDEVFEKFGQCYVTTVLPGVVKAWHYHKNQSDNFAVVSGMAKVVLYDGRADSPTKGEIVEIFAGVHNPVLVHIPPLVRHGFKGVGDQEAVIVNCPTEPYNYEHPDEFRVLPHGEIPYDWTGRDG